MEAEDVDFDVENKAPLDSDLDGDVEDGDEEELESDFDNDINNELGIDTEETEGNASVS